MCRKEEGRTVVSPMSPISYSTQVHSFSGACLSAGGTESFHCAGSGQGSWSPSRHSVRTRDPRLSPSGKNSFPLGPGARTGLNNLASRFESKKFNSVSNQSTITITRCGSTSNQITHTNRIFYSFIRKTRGRLLRSSCLALPPTPSLGASSPRCFARRRRTVATRNICQCLCLRPISASDSHPRLAVPNVTDRLGRHTVFLPETNRFGHASILRACVPRAAGVYLYGKLLIQRHRPALPSLLTAANVALRARLKAIRHSRRRYLFGGPHRAAGAAGARLVHAVLHAPRLWSLRGG